MYRTEICVKTLTVSDWLSEYCHPERFLPLCRECPEYGKKWSCPPDIPSAEEIAGPYRYVQVIGMKVIYDEWVRREAETSFARAEELRACTYGKAKARLLQALLALEQVFGDACTIMAGGCGLCGRCARMDGAPCRHPGQMRYSFSGLGFDLGRISSELLGMPLLWQTKGLPAYHVAVAALMCDKTGKRLLCNQARE